MPDWNRFIPTDFEYDFERDKLSVHGIEFEEAVECFFSDFQVRRNKSCVDFEESAFVGLKRVMEKKASYKT